MTDMPSIEELLAKLEELGVNTKILQEEGLSEEELREFAEKVLTLVGKKRRYGRHFA